MVKLDEKETKAVFALMANSDFIVFKGALEKTLSQLREDSDTIREMPEMYRSQGARSEIRSILDRIAECRKK